MSRCNAAGAFIPPYLVFRGKRQRNDLNNDLPPASVVDMSDSGYVKEDVFLRWLHHFQRCRVPGKCLLLLDGHYSHTKSMDVLMFCEENDIELLCLPAHCTHRLQPLDRSVFKALKAYYVSAANKWMRCHVGRKLTRISFGRVFQEAWGKAATVGNAVKGFQVCGIVPLNPDIIPDHLFEPSSPYTVTPRSPIRTDNLNSSDATEATEEGSARPVREATSSCDDTAQTKPTLSPSPSRKLCPYHKQRRQRRTLQERNGLHC